MSMPSTCYSTLGNLIEEYAFSRVVMKAGKHVYADALLYVKLEHDRWMEYGRAGGSTLLAGPANRYSYVKGAYLAFVKVFLT